MKTFTRSVIILAAAAILFLTGCYSNKGIATHIKKNELVILNDVPTYVQTAVTYANSLLPESNPFQLTVAASLKDAARAKHHQIPVIWVRLSSSTNPHPALAVLKDVRCIVISATHVEGLIFAFATNRGSFGPGDVGRKVGEPEELLALFLLHESGHLHNDAAIVPNAHLFPCDQLPNVLKRREFAADLFAASCISNALNSTVKSPRRDAAVILTNVTEAFVGRQALARVQMAPAHYYQRRGIDLLLRGPDLDWTYLGPRSQVFEDRSVSHPNLDLRLLSIRYLAAPSTRTRAELLHYLRERQDPAYANLMGLDLSLSSDQPMP